MPRPCFSEYGAETVRLCYWMCVLPTVRSVDCCSNMFPRCCLFRRAGASHSTLSADVLSHFAGRDARISFRCARATATSCAPGNSAASTRVPLHHTAGGASKFGKRHCPMCGSDQHQGQGVRSWKYCLRMPAACMSISFRDWDVSVLFLMSTERVWAFFR